MHIRAIVNGKSIENQTESLSEFISFVENMGFEVWEIEELQRLD